MSGRFPDLQVVAFISLVSTHHQHFCIDRVSVSQRNTVYTLHEDLMPITAKYRVRASTELKSYVLSSM